MSQKDIENGFATDSEIVNYHIDQLRKRLKDLSDEHNGEWIAGFGEAFARFSEGVAQIGTKRTITPRRIESTQWKVNCMDCGAYIGEVNAVCKPIGKCDNCRSIDLREQDAFVMDHNRGAGYAR